MARKLNDDETWIFDNSAALAHPLEATETEAFWRKLAERRDQSFDFAEADVWLGPYLPKCSRS